jgi:predicted nucleotidyltransferase
MIARVIDAAAITKIVALLDRRLGLHALFVFGSEACGTARADSDVDLASLFRDPPALVALLEAQADVERLLSRSVDLVDLATASPILALQVVRDGTCVYGADSRALAEFAAILPSRYFDLKRVRGEAERALVERISRA